METVIRVTLMYVVIYGGLRVLGKREFSQLTPAELVTLLLIPELVAQALTDEDFSLTNGIIAVSTIFVLVFVTSVLMHMSEKVENVIGGKPQVLVAHGKYLEDTMNKERVSPGEVVSAMHKAGLDKLDQVKWAILENDGQISIVPEDWAKSAVGDQEATEHETSL